MKLIKALSCAMILSLTFAGYAEAKGKSFSGGFRSQRTATAAPRPVQQPAQPLNMSKDLNAKPQSGAVKTADTQAAGSGSGWFRSGNTAKPAQPAGAMAAAPAAARQGGGFMNNIMWFMLGSSLASHGNAASAPAAAPNTEQGTAQSVVQSAQASDQVQANAQVQAPGNNELNISDPAIIAPPVAEKESFFMSLLRIVLWGGIFFGIYKLAKTLLRPKANSSAKKSNYTFGNH